jgi:hypothetical protein
VATLNPSEIAAYIGAAAWLPQIGNWIYRLVARPKVLILTEATSEIGFTSLGPIFNSRIAFSASRKDAIIDNLEVELRHENGDTHVFRWVGYTETVSQITDASGVRQHVEKDQSAIALKISTGQLLEKHVKFQEKSFRDEIMIFGSSAIEELNYLRKNDPNYRDTALKSKKFSDLIDLYRKHFWWKEGKYTFRFRCSSPNRTTLKDQVFSFSLRKDDVEAIEQNIPLLKTEYENLLKADLPDYKRQNVFWNWRNPVTSKSK